MAIIGTTIHHDIHTYDYVHDSDIIRSELTTGSTKAPKLGQDGRFLWISDIALSQIDQRDKTFDPPSFIDRTSLGYKPVGLTFDGRYLWTIQSNGTINQIDPNTMTSVGSFALTVSTYKGLTNDGRFLWTTDDVTKKAQRIDPAKQGQMIEWTTASDFNDWVFCERFLWALVGDAVSGQATVEIRDPLKGSQIQAHNAFSLSATDDANSIESDGRFFYIMGTHTTTP